MKKTVMFDLDGTLLPFLQDEFIKLYFGGLCRKLAPLGYESESLVKVVWKGTAAMIKNDGSRKNSDAFWDTFRAAFPDLPDARELCDDFYTHEFDKVKVCLKKAVDHKPMIERLKKAGYDVVLATNPIFPRTAQLTRMSWVGLSESDFLYITDYDNSSYCKPNPDYFKAVLETIGADAADCVMIGNSVEEDILSTKSLGMENFLVTDFIENPNGVDITQFHGGTIEQAEAFLING